LLGMAFSRYREQAQVLVARYRLPLLLVAGAGYAGYVLGWPQPPHHLMLMKLPAALLLVHVLLKVHHWFGTRLDYIAHISFGIFFVHAYFISFIKVITVYVLSGRIYAGESGADLPGSFPLFLLYAALVLGFSVLLIWTAQRVLGSRSRLLIGA
jgi:hypothetical protein